MFRKIYNLLVILRKLSISGAVDVIDEMKKMPKILKFVFFIFSIGKKDK